MIKETFYFSHDYNTRTDKKIKKLISKHGFQGYGLFWALVEDLYNNANVLQTDYELIAYDLRVDEKLIKSIINDFGLFEINKDNFKSSSIERRLNEREDKSEKASKSAFARWNKDKENANAMQSHNDSNAIKDIKGKDIKGNSFPKKEEIFNYFKEKGYTSASAQKFIDTWEKRKWLGNNKKIIDWVEMAEGWTERAGKESTIGKFPMPKGMKLGYDETWDIETGKRMLFNEVIPNEAPPRPCGKFSWTMTHSTSGVERWSWCI